MEDRCVCCGEIIREGRMVCYACEKDPMQVVSKQSVDAAPVESKKPSIIRTVVAIDHGSRHPRHMVLNFMVPGKSFDLFGAVKAAATEFCKSEDGKKVFSGNCHAFNWGDFDLHVPQWLCRKHGFERVQSLTGDDEVNFDEQLVDESDVFEDDEEDVL